MICQFMDLVLVVLVQMVVVTTSPLTTVYLLITMHVMAYTIITGENYWNYWPNLESDQLTSFLCPSGYCENGRDEMAINEVCTHHRRDHSISTTTNWMIHIYVMEIKCLCKKMKAAKKEL